MGDTMEQVDARTALAELHDALSRLLSADLTPLCDTEMIAVLHDAERFRNRLATADHACLAEITRRGLPATHLARTTGTLLVHLLGIDPGEAQARVRAAGPRGTLTGQPLEPKFPVVADAQAHGTLSPRKAAIITRCLNALPDTVWQKGWRVIMLDGRPAWIPPKWINPAQSPITS